MKSRHDFVLQCVPEIDEQVAATQQINLLKRRILTHVVIGEQDCGTQRGNYADAFAVLYEVLICIAFGDVIQSRHSVDAFAGHIQSVLVDVGGEDLDVVLQLHLGAAQRLCQKDCD